MPLPSIRLLRCARCTSDNQLLELKWLDQILGYSLSHLMLWVLVDGELRTLASVQWQLVLTLNQVSGFWGLGQQRQHCESIVLLLRQGHVVEF